MGLGLRRSGAKPESGYLGGTEVGSTLRCLQSHTAEQDGLDSDSTSATGLPVTSRKSLHLMRKMRTAAKPTLQCCGEDYK